MSKGLPTLPQRIALRHAHQFGLKPWGRGWTGDGSAIIANATVKALHARGFVKVADGPGVSGQVQVTITPAGEAFLICWDGELP